MRIEPSFKLRDIAGETIVVNQGKVDKDMTKIISLNASAKYLFETLQGEDFLLEEVAKALVDKYGISIEKANNDAFVWVDALRKCSIITN